MVPRDLCLMTVPPLKENLLTLDLLTHLMNRLWGK